jgi:hypothetical protein
MSGRPYTAARRDVAESSAGATPIDAAAAWLAAKGKRVKGGVAFDKTLNPRTAIETAANAEEDAAAAATAAIALADLADDDDAETVAEKVGLGR